MYPIINELDKLTNLYAYDDDKDTAAVNHPDGRTITIERSIGRHNGGVRLFYCLSDSDGIMLLYVVQDLCADNADDHALMPDGTIVNHNDPAVWTQFHECFPTFPHLTPAE